MLFSLEFQILRIKVCVLCLCVQCEGVVCLTVDKALITSLYHLQPHIQECIFIHKQPTASLLLPLVSLHCTTLLPLLRLPVSLWQLFQFYLPVCVIFFSFPPNLLCVLSLCISTP